MQLSPYPDIDVILSALVEGISAICGENLIGIYLTGSLSYGDFNPASSDIDLVTVVQNAVINPQLEQIKQLHQQVEIRHPNWAERIECSYVPIGLFTNLLPPKEPRPYVGEGKFYPDADYGNEWIINNYLLYEHGIALVGSEFSTLIDPIEIQEVQKACIRDLFKEWQPIINDPDFLQNSHYQAYLVLNLCRILYTVLQGETGSKKVSATWVKSTFPTWVNLIQTAEAWEYGVKMEMESQTVDFIKFAVEKMSETAFVIQ